jgi:phosphoglycerol transferase MdoB-like AlkP superfamily enzyme
MENQPNAIGSLFETAGDYLETRVDLLKLKAVDKSSDIASSIVSRIVICLIITFGIFILNIGLSIWLGTVLGEVWYGFFAVGGFYILLAVVLVIFRNKWLKGPLNDLIVKKLLN